MTNKEFHREMGCRLKALRCRAQITQEGLAAAVGVHRNTLSVIERGERLASVWVIERCAAVLHVPLRALVPRTHKETDRLSAELKKPSAVCA